MPSFSASPAQSHDDRPIVQDPRILHIERVDIAPNTNTHLGNVVNIGTHYHAPRTSDAERDHQRGNGSTPDQSWFKIFYVAFCSGVAGSWVGDVTKAWVAAVFDYAQQYVSCTYEASLHFVHEMSAQNGCTGSICLLSLLVDSWVFDGETSAQIVYGNAARLLFHIMAANKVIWYLPAFSRVVRYAPKTSMDLQAIDYIHWMIRLRGLDHVVVRIAGQDIIQKHVFWYLVYVIWIRCMAVDQMIFWPHVIFWPGWLQAIDEIFCRYTCPGTMEILEVTTILMSKVHYPVFRQPAYQLAGRMVFTIFPSCARTSQAVSSADLESLHGAYTMHLSLFFALCLKLLTPGMHLYAVVPLLGYRILS
ncbi:hypothetical protein LTR70_002446 [Exophiala xenobiotica]|uniref:Uncharacterized protein n=1 Tax=Lithohypha guttulata TaxID=1690604 RepID=A0ABR0KMY5_9EURO|nr:hypothetical protein LTR24_001443 [Lithohypha guttulata]KAK5325474.1 hypothetical protein LTR70_002446 [Exophiala xenobiotica]